MTEQVKKDDPEVLDQPIEAAAQVVQELERRDQGTPADKTVETIAEADDAEAKPAAEATVLKISEPLQQHIAPSGDQLHHVDAHTTLKGTGAELAGEHHPVHTVDGSGVNLDPNSIPVFDTPYVKALRHDPTNAGAAHELVEERKGNLTKFKEFLANKLVAGKKAA